MLSKLLLLLFLVFPQPADPRTPAQLLEPADLAARITNAKAPLLICVGPSGLIKGSVETGPAKEAANLDKLKTLLAKEADGHAK
jgi:thiosulfate/3-mercaptopyruvate sulfurtransferase